MADVKLLSKISLKGIEAQPAKHSLKPGDHFGIAAVYGHANKHDTVVTTYGDSTRFYGSFKAINLRTGEQFKAGKIFLPGVVEELLADAIDQLGDDGSTNVEFAFEIGVEYAEKGNTGYAYTVKPLVEIKESEPLTALENHVLGKLKALPAPEAAEKTKGGKTK